MHKKLKKGLLKYTDSENEFIRSCLLDVLSNSLKYTIGDIAHILIRNGPGSSILEEYLIAKLISSHDEFFNLTKEEIEFQLKNFINELPPFNLGPTGNFYRNIVSRDDIYTNFTKSQRLIFSDLDALSDYTELFERDFTNLIDLFLRILIFYTSIPQVARGVSQSHVPMLICSYLNQTPTDKITNKLILKLFQNLSAFGDNLDIFKGIF
ncbi:hypothetical protein HZS_7008 [Henneguya salminicola]|nr:hypothetical protein HZS_7008 [Henneguya salminicola]